MRSCQWDGKKKQWLYSGERSGWQIKSTPRFLWSQSCFNLQETRDSNLSSCQGEDECLDRHAYSETQYHIFEVPEYLTVKTWVGAYRVGVKENTKSQQCNFDLSVTERSKKGLSINIAYGVGNDVHKISDLTLTFFILINHIM